MGSVNEMRSALKDITMSENKRVVAVKKVSESSEIRDYRTWWSESHQR
jgi:hypothetical protein